MRIFIPSNSYGIPENYYTINEVVHMLRHYKNSPVHVQFIADMLEQ